MRNTMIMLLLFITTGANSQNLSQLSEKERNLKLVAAAKAVIKKYAPDYVKYTEGKYTVEFVVFNEGASTERSVYWAKFLEYDKKEESFREGFAVAVEFRIKDGAPTIIWNGQGLGLPILKEPLTRGQKVPKLEYKRQSPYKQNADGSWSM